MFSTINDETNAMELAEERERNYKIRETKMALASKIHSQIERMLVTLAEMDEVDESHEDDVLDLRRELMTAKALYLAILKP